jgi:inosine-uridine nucleoside N-ribohydrolase
MTTGKGAGLASDRAYLSHSHCNTLLEYLSISQSQSDQDMAYAGRLILLCIDPLTNVAVALLAEPHLLMSIRSIIMMGGSGAGVGDGEIVIVAFSASQ